MLFLKWQTNQLGSNTLRVELYFDTETSVILYQTTQYDADFLLIN